jgi:hypothetical protein
VSIAPGEMPPGENRLRESMIIILLPARDGVEEYELLLGVEGDMDPEIEWDLELGEHRDPESHHRKR